MMKQLSTRSLVIYQPRHGVRLSDDGNRAALKVLRRHRLLELFLVEVLGLDWSDVHEEAEVLEHAISDHLLTHIDEMLGHPTCDPHGSPIPDSQGRLPEQEATPLSAVSPGAYTLIRVLGGEDNSFLAWLADHHLRPGACFELIAHDKPAGILRLRTASSDDETQLGTVAAHRLLVRKTK